MKAEEKKYFLANWKMYLNRENTLSLANFFVKEKKDDPSLEVGLFPSSLYTLEIKNIVSNSQISLGVQNGFWVDFGGYTGELSMKMIRESGCDIVLVGHSERRRIFEETDEEVNKKMLAALEADLTPVLCVGETESERSELKTEEVVERQLRLALADLPPNKKIFVAYEPVWAIGTGKDCSPEEAKGVHSLIARVCKEVLPESNFIFLYGGSVNSKNIEEHLADLNVHGVLVGSASIKEDEVKNMFEAMQKAKM